MKIFSYKKKKPVADKRLMEASQWYMDIKSESMSPETQADFMDWLSEDHTNKSKFELIGSVWESLDELEDDPLKLEIIGKSQTSQHLNSKLKWLQELSVPIPQIRFVAVFATIILIIGGLWIMQADRFRHEIYKTAIGEQKTVYLSDGSTVHLDTNTVVITSFTEKLRNIKLKDGKALFAVAHEPDRPFIVTTGRVAIRAIGTEFSVYKRKKGEVAISVTEGRIQVTRKDERLSKTVQAVSEESKKRPEVSPGIIAYNSVEPSHFSQQIVESGQEIVVDDQKEIYQINQVDIKHVNAWQEGRLDFRNKPLSDVIEELNRYVENKIIIGDARLNDININVYFKLKNRKDFVSTLKLVMPIASHTNSKGQTIITKREAG